MVIVPSSYHGILRLFVYRFVCMFITYINYSEIYILHYNIFISNMIIISSEYILFIENKFPNSLYRLDIRTKIR